MLSGGRRRPLNPLRSGLSVFALLFAVLCLCFVTRTATLHVADQQIASISHSVVAAAPSVARPLSGPEPAAPAAMTVVVTTALGILMVLARTRPALGRAVLRRPLGRAPPR